MPVIALLCLGALASCGGPYDPVAELEERLYAPCCDRQSLRDHQSPSASKLRAEIASRVAAGESAQVIERDLVLRFGERIRALPQGGDPRWMIGVAVTLACIGGALILARVGRRRGRATTPAAPAAELAPAERDRFQDRLDDELALID